LFNILYVILNLKRAFFQHSLRYFRPLRSVVQHSVRYFKLLTSVVQHSLRYFKPLTSIVQHSLHYFKPLKSVVQHSLHYFKPLTSIVQHSLRYFKPLTSVFYCSNVLRTWLPIYTYTVKNRYLAESLKLLKFKFSLNVQLYINFIAQFP